MTYVWTLDRVRLSITRPVRSPELSICRSSGPGCAVCFFQAEDGIRDLIVTGVQTCALPICLEALDAGVQGHRGCGEGRPAPDRGTAAAAVGDDPRHGRPDRPGISRGAVPQSAEPARPAAAHADHRPAVRALQLHRRRAAGGVCGARPQGERPEPAGREERPSRGAGPGELPVSGPAARSQSGSDPLGPQWMKVTQPISFATMASVPLALNPM